MKRAQVSIGWPKGLHLRPASRLVAAARSYRSAISLKHRNRVADARSILAVLMLGASCGTTLDLEASGDDEEAAISGLTEVFEASGSSDAGASIYHVSSEKGLR